ncbi:MAG TPA: hypothetical protein VLA40_07495 [Rheinheimera sp.]|nr:hypothetical protein [Rheinheimera sp.]
MSQNNPAVYAQAIQAQLASIVAPVPVYANFNRNYATQPKFITWNLRNVHQPVYTGTNQNNKGIDRPIFQISVFTQSFADAMTISNSILQSLHGYSGQFGGATGFYISKADVDWLYNTYDNEIGLQQVIMDCTLDIPT